MRKISLFSTGCPQCLVLKRKFDENNIDYDYVLISDEKALELGFKSMPIVNLNDGIDGKNYNFIESVRMISTLIRRSI